MNFKIVLCDLFFLSIITVFFVVGNFLQMLFICNELSFDIIYTCTHKQSKSLKLF